MKRENEVKIIEQLLDEKKKLVEKVNHINIKKFK
jgi:hypothetical protein